MSKSVPWEPCWHYACLMFDGTSVGLYTFTPASMPPSMTPRSTRWRQCICHTGKSWICLRVAGHCQHSGKRIYMYLSMPGFEVLKVWSFRFLENDHASSVLCCFLTHVFLLHCVSAVLFWKILRLSGLCSHIEDAVLAHVVKGHPINCRPSLYFHSDPCFSFWSHLCVLSMYKRTVCVCYYEETHSMYLHSMNTQCICILSAHAAPYRGIWHQHRVCSSLAKTSQNNEKPWQLWRRGERGCSLYCNLDEGHARHSAIAEALDSQL